MTESVTDRPTPRGRTARVAAVFVLLAFAAFVWVLGTRTSGTDVAVSSPLIDRPAPEIAGLALDGEEFRLTDRRGRFVVVNFFATWCIPCQVEHPELVAFHEAHAAPGEAEVVSIVFDDQPAQVRSFFERHGGDWPVVVDHEGRAAFAYGVARVPESFLVAPDGTVVAKLTGGVTRAGLEALLDRYS